jgi:hypothetical protein
MTFAWEDHFSGAKVLMIGAGNKVTKVVDYSH